MSWDLIAAFPLDHLLSDFWESPWFRLNRCIKMINLDHYFYELNRTNVAYEWTRLQTIWLYFFVAAHWIACAYYAVSTLDGYSDSWASWSPSVDLEIDPTGTQSSRVLALRWLRGLFYGFTTLVKRGETLIPDYPYEFVFATITAFIGLVVMALLIAEMANLYISYSGNEVDFRKNQLTVERFLERRRVSTQLSNRAHAFMTSFWASHRGVNYQAFFEDLPLIIRTQTIRYIARSPLHGFTAAVFRPITKHSNMPEREIELLERSLAQHLKFESYPGGENVITEGSVSKAMYFVVNGLLHVDSTEALPMMPTRYRKGEYFGEQGLLGCSVSSCTVRTVRACDLFSLSSEALLEVILCRPVYQTALSVLVEAYRYLHARCEGSAGVMEVSEQEWTDVLLLMLTKRTNQWKSVLQKAHASPPSSPHAGQTHSNTASNPTTVANATLLFEAFKGIQQPSDCAEALGMLLKLIVPHNTLGSGRTMTFDRGSIGSFSATFANLHMAHRESNAHAEGNR